METMAVALERKRSLMHVSEKPWGEFTKADYTPEQWHRACLIHDHTGDPTSKDQCKLPVRTPGGALNRNGVHSAAAALAGARGGVSASDDDKSKAAKSLTHFYTELGEKPPESLLEHADFSEEELAHYGVVGMKWGVRQDRGHEGERVKNKKLGKLDRKWENEARSARGFITMHNMVADKMNNGRLDKVNNKPEFKHADFSEKGLQNAGTKKLYDKYLKEIGDQHIAAFNEMAREYGVNPSGTKRIKITVDHKTGSVDASFEDIQHADFDPSNLHWVGKLDSTGHIVSWESIDEGDLEQSDISFEDFLMHYGVVGMHWGVRRSRAEREAHSEDATRVGGIHSRVSSHKTTKILSNKELRDAIDRMNLEQQYSRLSNGLDKTRRQKAVSWVKDMLLGVGKESAKNFANAQVKDAIDKKTSQGRYDPISVAEREAKAAKFRERQSS